MRDAIDATIYSCAGCLFAAGIFLVVCALVGLNPTDVLVNL